MAAGGSAALEQMQEIPDQEAPSSEAAAEVPPGIQSDLVHRAIEIIRGDFEERTWQAFWRTAVDGQPAPQVADELDMTPRAVRQAKISRAGALARDAGRGLRAAIPHSEPHIPHFPKTFILRRLQRIARATSTIRVALPHCSW